MSPPLEQRSLPTQVVVRRPSLGPVRRLFHDNASNLAAGDGVIMTTISNGSGDGVSPVRMRRKSTENSHSRQPSRVNDLLSKAASNLQNNSGEMNLNLIPDPSPYSSVETNVGGYTNAACTASKSSFSRNITSYSHDNPIDTIVLSSPNRGITHTVTSDGLTQPIVIQMPSHAMSTDNFTYALEHVL